jgi:hypothetical protein
VLPYCCRSTSSRKEKRRGFTIGTKLCTILQAHTRNVLLHASDAPCSTRKRFRSSPIEKIFRILQTDFRELLFHALR